MPGGGAESRWKSLILLIEEQRSVVRTEAFCLRTETVPDLGRVLVQSHLHGQVSVVR